MIDLLLDLALGRALDRGLDAALGPRLAREMTKEAEEWAKQLPEPFRGLDPRSLTTDSLRREQPNSGSLDSQTHIVGNVKVPTTEEWVVALTQRWEAVRKTHSAREAHSFFRADPEEVEPLLADLAGRLHRACARDADLFRVTVIDLLSRLSQPAQPPGPAPFLVPFARNPDFVGRDGDLRRLHNKVFSSDGVVGIRPTVLVGLGGIGKTLLASEYAHAYRSEYEGGVFWVNAVNPLDQEFASIGEALGVAERGAAVSTAAHALWSYLEAHPESLVIVDNVLDPASLNVPFTQGLVVANLPCRTLFTTRQRTFPKGFVSFDVKVLAEGAAMRLLLRARPSTLQEDHPEWGTARLICASLGWLPLALELAASYLETYPEVTVQGYMDRLRVEGRLDTVDDTVLRSEELPTRHEVAVEATLQTQWARLSSSEAQLVFRAAGQFPEGTWIPIHRLGLLTGISASSRPGRPPPLSSSIRTLHGVSLIEELTGETIRLHPLVQEFAARLSPESFRSEMLEHLAGALSGVEKVDLHVTHHGVDMTLADLRAGLWIGRGNEGIAAYRDVSTLERVVDRESFNLRDEEATDGPVYVLQQLAHRARVLDELAVAESAERALAERGLPYLRLTWGTGHESMSMLRVLNRHTDEVTAVAVGGRIVASGSRDHTVRLWDFRTGREVRVLRGHEDWVTSLALSRNGEKVFSGSHDQSVRIWDVATGQEERVLHGFPGRVSAIALSPEGRRVVVAGADPEIRVLDAETGRELMALSGHETWVSALALTSDGALAVSGSHDGEIRIWDLASGQEEWVRRGHQGVVEHLVIVPGDHRVVSDSDDGTVCVWDLASGRELERFDDDMGIASVQSVPDSARLVFGCYDGTIRIRDLVAGSEEHVLHGHTGGVQAVAISREGRHVVSGSVDRTVRLWDLSVQPTPAEAERRDHRANALAVARDGSYVVTGSEDTVVRVCDIGSGREMHRFEGHTDVVHAVVTISDGRTIVSGGGDATVRVWDVASGRERFVLSGHNSDVRALTVLPRGDRIVSGSDDGTLWLWDTAVGTGKPILEDYDEPVQLLAPALGGALLVIGSLDSSLEVWNLESGDRHFTLEGHQGWATSLAVSKSGQLLASGSDDGTVCVWDLRTGAAVRCLRGHKAPVQAVAMTAGGARVLSGSDDATIRVWDLSTGRESSRFGCPGPVRRLARVPKGGIIGGDANGALFHLRYVEPVRT